MQTPPLIHFTVLILITGIIPFKSIQAACHADVHQQAHKVYRNDSLSLDKKRIGLNDFYQRCRDYYTGDLLSRVLYDSLSALKGTDTYLPRLQQVSQIAPANSRTSWQAQILLGELAKSRKAYKQAYRNFEQALTYIASQDLLPEAIPDKTYIRALQKEIEKMQLLSTSLIPPSRSAVNLLSVRGSCVTQTAKPIRFATNQATLSMEGSHYAESTWQLLRVFNMPNIHIEGHADERGSLTHNQTLSERRAATMRDYLIKKGYPAKRITSAGRGETEPYDDAERDTLPQPEQWRLDRRVVLNIDEAICNY